MAYDLFPGMDSNYNFPPAVRKAISEYPELAGIPEAPSDLDLNDINETISYSIFGSLQRKNLPADVGSSILHTWLIHSDGDRPKVQLLIKYGSNPAIYYRFSGAFWADWTRMDAGAVEIPEIPEIPKLTPTSPSASKTVPLAITVGGGITDWDTSEGGVRMPVEFGFEVSRYRVHFRNINPRQGTPQTGNRVEIPYVVMGESTGYPTYFSAPLIASSLSGTGDLVTPWINTGLKKNQKYLLGYTWRSQTPPKRVVGGGWLTEYGGSAFRSNAADAFPTTSLPLDTWIEAEIDSDVPVVAAFGDSISSGVGADLPVHDSWLSQWARENGAAPVHYTASGDTMQGWSDPSHYKWQRWQDLNRPDAVIHAMGSNDVFGGASLNEMRTRRTATLRILSDLVSPVIYSATILPRSGVAGNTETIRRSYNGGLKTLSDRARDLFDFVPAVSADDENISSSVTPDGTHLTTVGYRDVSRTINRPITSNQTGTVVDARPWMISDHNFLSGTRLVYNGSSVTMTINARANAGIAIGKDSIIGTIPPEYRSLIDVYAQGQSVGQEGMLFKANGDIASPAISAGSYFKVSASWTR